jgi:hypothetical protein
VSERRLATVPLSAARRLPSHERFAVAEKRLQILKEAKLLPDEY